MKSKFALWISPEVKEIVEEHYKADDCRSRSEYIENAIPFYSGYLDAKKADRYLPRTLATVLQGTLGVFADRMGRLLFKYAVEQNISNHILAADTDMDVQTYDRLRGRSYREVQETNGRISFRDDLIFQKTV